MNDDWDYYLCRLDEDRASISLDLSRAVDAPVSTHPCSAHVSVSMLLPREDGLSSDEEYDTLLALEDHLSTRLRAANTLYVGRLTARGSRVFYFYTADPDSWRGDVDAAMAQFSDYRYQSAGHADPDWLTYKRFLYPSPDDYKRIQTRRRT